MKLAAGSERLGSVTPFFGLTAEQFDASLLQGCGFRRLLNCNDPFSCRCLRIKLCINRPKRQRTAALQNAGAPTHAPESAKRLGVRLSSAAFESARKVMAIVRHHTRLVPRRTAAGQDRLLGGDDAVAHRVGIHSLAVEGRGGYINAFTTKEYSCYYAKVFKNELQPTVRVLSDLVIHPKFDASDLQNERKVVLSEMQEVYDDPEDWGMDFIEEKVFKGNPLSMPIIGRASMLRSFTTRDLRSFHSRNFTAERIVISVAGNFDRSELMDHISAYFSPLAPVSKIYIRKKPDANKVRSYTVRREAGRQVHLVLGSAAPGLDDPGRYAASMVGVILGDGSSSRLYKNIREKNGLAYSIYSYGSAYADTGVMGIYACTAVGDFARAEKKILSTIEEFARYGPTKEEVERAKAQMKAGIIFSLENLWDRASLFARDELYYRAKSKFSESLESIEKVTESDIAEAAGNLTKDGLASVRILPKKPKA